MWSVIGQHELEKCNSWINKLLCLEDKDSKQFVMINESNQGWLYFTNLIFQNTIRLNLIFFGRKSDFLSNFWNLIYAVDRIYISWKIYVVFEFILYPINHMSSDFKHLNHLWIIDKWEEIDRIVRKELNNW